MKIFEIDEKFMDYTETDFYKKFGDSIFHNSRNSEGEGFVPFTPRRIPKDTAAAFHQEVNQLSKQQFGIPVRSLLFALPSELGAKNISRSGTVYSVYPVSNDYRIFYAENVVDMTVDLDATGYDIFRQTQVYVEKLLYEFFQNSDAIDSALRQKYINDISKKLDDIVATHEDNKNISWLKEFYDLCFADMKKFLVKLHLGEDVQDVIEKAFAHSRTHFQNRAYSYVSSLKEVTSREELSEVSKFVEIMVYDPKGFIFRKI